MKSPNTAIHKSYQRTANDHYRLSSELSSILECNKSSVCASPLFDEGERWLLWIEPIATDENTTCPTLFTSDNGQELIGHIESGWQFSEFMWFTPRKVLHGLETDRFTALKLDKDLETLRAVETAYLRQDMHRFQHTPWTKEIASLIKGKTLGSLLDTPVKSMEQQGR